MRFFADYDRSAAVLYAHQWAYGLSLIHISEPTRTWGETAPTSRLSVCSPAAV